MEPPQNTLLYIERIRALRDIRTFDPALRVEAAQKLATDPFAFDDLRELLRNESNENTRHAITFALSWHKDLRSWPILLDLLSDEKESPKVRGQAAEGLAYKFHHKRKGTPGHLAAIKTLTACLESPWPEVRYFSVFALGESGEPEIMPKLIEMLEDHANPHGFVGTIADEAREALAKLRTR